MTDPFEPRPETKALTESDIYYNEIDDRGMVCKYKIESGVPVKVKELGNMKQIFDRAVQAAAVMTPAQVDALDFSEMPHIAIAAVRLSCAAAEGDLKSTQELFDRIAGKAKMVSENTNLNITLEDVLNGVGGKSVDV